MNDVIVPLPDDLKNRAELAARLSGISLVEYVRDCVAQSFNKQPADPFYSDTAVFRGDGPTDMAENHDDYLYGDRQ